MPTIHKSLAVLAALAFFLPFVTISCNGKPLVEVSGAKLAQCAVSTCSANDVMSPEMKSMAGANIPDMNVPTPDRPGQASDFEGANFVLFAAIACVVAAVALFFGGRGGELLSGVASVTSIVLLFVFRTIFNGAIAPHIQSHSQSLGANVVAALMKMQLQFSVGFWVSIIVSAVSAILAFKGTTGQRAGLVRATSSSQPPASL